MLLGSLTATTLLLASACSSAAGAFVPEVGEDGRGFAAHTGAPSIASVRFALRFASKEFATSRPRLIPFIFAQKAAYPQCSSSTIGTLEAASACWACRASNPTRDADTCATTGCPIIQPEGMSENQALLCPEGNCCVRGIQEPDGAIIAAVIDGIFLENDEISLSFDRCPPCVAPLAGLECASFSVPEPDAASDSEVECAASSSGGASSGTGVFISPDGTVSESGDEATQATRAPAETAASSTAPRAEGSSSTKTDSTDDSAKCFPAEASVELEHGGVVRMDGLAIGDSVKVGENKFSKVFMFTHKMADVNVDFVLIRTASGASLSLTGGHYIYANDALVAAATVGVGDELMLGHGERSAITSVSHAPGRGLYNPQTLSGDIVVNGVVASTYTTAVDPGFAHILLAPLRALSHFGLGFTRLESGGGSLTAYAPGGTETIV